MAAADPVMPVSVPTGAGTREAGQLRKTAARTNHKAHCYHGGVVGAGAIMLALAVVAAIFLAVILVVARQNYISSSKTGSRSSSRSRRNRHRSRQSANSKRAVSKSVRGTAHVQM